MEIDHALARLDRAGSHRGLEGMEDRVLAAIADRPAVPVATGTIVGAAVGALLIGAASGGLPAQQARAAPVVAVGVPSALVPSSLLLRTR